MSDTFFGHFCWAVLFEKGESYLQDFLAAYEKQKPAPVLFSSALNSGYLPRPAMPQARRKKIKQFVDRYFVADPDGVFKGKSEKQKQFEGMAAVKKWNKFRFMSSETWLKLKNNYSETGLLEIFYEQFRQGTDKEAVSFETVVSASNSINRVSGAVSEEGGLFQRESSWFYPNACLDLYVEVNLEEMVPLVNWFLTDYLPLNGFGKDKSVGMGYFEISQDNSFSPDLFKVDNENASMTLSAAAFEGMEQYHSFYRLMTKFGKLGGTFSASSPSGGPVLPFKKPILMLEPGAIFFTDEELNRRPMLKHVHSDERIRHCGVPVTVPVNIMEDNLNVTI
jgi:CRISPR-associated protein Csm4